MYYVICYILKAECIQEASKDYFLFYTVCVIVIFYFIFRVVIRYT